MKPVREASLKINPITTTTTMANTSGEEEEMKSTIKVKDVHKLHSTTASTTTIAATATHNGKNTSDQLIVKKVCVCEDLFVI